MGISLFKPPGSCPAGLSGNLGLDPVVLPAQMDGVRHGI